MEPTDIDISEVWRNFSHLALAYILAFPIGFYQERETSGAGLRTFPLVSLASCGYMLTALSVFDAHEPLARMAYGIITGIGFIGGGAILKSTTERRVVGTAAAGAIWCTGAIGIAVAWEQYEIAVTLSVVTFLTLVSNRILAAKGRRRRQVPDSKFNPE